MSVSRRYPAPKWGMMTGTSGKPSAVRRQREGITQAPVEAAGQTELLADAHRERAAVRKHHGPMCRGRCKHALDARLVEPVTVHGREEAHASQPELRQTLLQPLIGAVSRRIVHEEADEPPRVTRHRFGDRLSVARDARDQRGARDALSIELEHPAVREARPRWRAAPIRARQQWRRRRGRQRSAARESVTKGNDSGYR